MSAVTPEVEALLAQLAESAKRVRAIPVATLRAMAANPETRLKLEESTRDFARMATLFANGSRENRLCADFLSKQLRRTHARIRA